MKNVRIYEMASDNSRLRTVMDQPYRLLHSTHASQGRSVISILGIVRLHHGRSREEDGMQMHIKSLDHRQKKRARDLSSVRLEGISIEMPLLPRI